MVRRSFAKVRELVENREAVFVLEVMAAITAGLLFAVGFLDAGPVELVIITLGLASAVALGYGIRFLMRR